MDKSIVTEVDGNINESTIEDTHSHICIVIARGKPENQITSAAPFLSNIHYSITINSGMEILFLFSN